MAKQPQTRASLAGYVKDQLRQQVRQAQATSGIGGGSDTVMNHPTPVTAQVVDFALTDAPFSTNDPVLLTVDLPHPAGATGVVVYATGWLRAANNSGADTDLVCAVRVGPHVGPEQAQPVANGARGTVSAGITTTFTLESIGSYLDDYPILRLHVVGRVATGATTAEPGNDNTATVTALVQWFQEATT